MERPCYIFDIDGTLADLTHRLHHIQAHPKNWDAFFDNCVDDAPIGHICMVASSLAAAGAELVYVSGRSDRVRTQTVDWLRDVACLPVGRLYMRKDGDHRPDDLVKRELLAELRSDGLVPIMAFDDRNRVVSMWRELGVPCAQVAPGDF